MIKQLTIKHLSDQLYHWNRKHRNKIHHDVLLLLLPALLVLTPGLARSAPLALSDVPLAISNAVDPNVMLLLDTSGSMDNIVWADTYNDSTIYPDWSDGGTYYNQNINNIELRTNGFGNFTNNANINCSAAFKCTVDLGGTHELILPDPRNNGRTQYSGNYLNYLFDTYPSGTDLADGNAPDIPNETRLTVMKDVATTLINNTTGMRYGLATFTSNEGASIVQECGALYSDITDSINDNNFVASGGTPLAESLYEITRYYRGLNSHYRNNNPSFTSPIEYQCQKNFTIIVTDGLPTRDNNFPSDDPDIASGCNSDAIDTDPPCLINYDELAPVLTTADYFDGTAPLNDGFVEGATLYLDDIAKFAYETDMSPLDGVQNMETFTVGFSIDTNVLQEAAHYGSGLDSSTTFDTDPLTTHYFTASNRQQLLAQLQAAITNIEGKSSSAASVASNTGSISDSSLTFIYQGLFESKYWTGNLVSFEINPVTGQIANPIDPQTQQHIPTADASANIMSMSSSARNIFTRNSDTQLGIPFEWNSLSASQMADLGGREEILNYTRGDQACETNSALSCPASQVKNLRDRNINGNGKLGSIINSSPIYIGAPSLRYPEIWPGGPTAPENIGGPNTYGTFKDAQKNRTPIVYVGSNDGMLHAFNAETLAEEFAYIPGTVFNKLAEYSNTGYTHKYLVDGTPTIIDAFIGTQWKTILVGGLNNGGQGVFALDITNPTSFSASNVLWEFSDSDDADLGYTYSRPAIVRMKNGKWAAIFGNGYNNNYDVQDTNVSATGNAVLFIVDIETGSLIKKIDTGVGIADDPTSLQRPNGLATVAVVDLNNDYVGDYIYAGDLFGNLWRFDITSSNPAGWTVFGRGTTPSTSPIFVANDGSGNVQPITVRPEVSRTTTSGLMVYFGTGMYLQQGDKSNIDRQSFYGLIDDPEGDKLAASPVPLVTRGSMIQQNVVKEEPFSGSELVRHFSKNAGSDTYTSWFVDLPTDGERVVGQPLLRGSSYKKIIFTSIVPTEDACGFGGNSWLIELDGRNGNATNTPVFDLNYDGKLDKDDNGSGASLGDVYNGWSHSGITTAPTVVTAPDKEFKFMSSSTGKLPSISEALPEGSRGRIMWQQLK